MRRRAPVMAIDLGGASVRATERGFGRRENRVRLERREAGSAYAQDEISGLVRTLRRSGFRARHAVVVLPKQMTRVMPADLPPRGSGAPMETIARAQAAELSPGDLGAFEVAVVVHKPDGSGSSLTVAPHEGAALIFEALQDAGVQPLRLLPPAAVACAFAVADDDRTVRLVADVGWTDTSMYVLRGDELVVDRRVRSIGFSTVAASVTEAIGCDPSLGRFVATAGRRASIDLAAASARALRAFGLNLVAEITATGPFAARSAGMLPAEVLITGGGADDAELAEFLEVSLDVPVRCVDMATALTGVVAGATAVGAAGKS